MTSTRADARTALFNALELGNVDARDRAMAPGDVTPPAVLVVYQGSTDTEFLFNVEVYVRASDPSVADAQDTLDTLIQQVDDALDGASIGPVGDTVNYSADLDAWVGIFPVNVPRDDF